MTTETAPPSTALGSDMFIFDNVVHVHNFDPSNLVDGLAERANLNIYTGSTKTFPPDLRFGSYANFAKAWSVEDIHRIVFDESTTDMCMAQAVPLYDYWKDGLAGVERQQLLVPVVDGEPVGVPALRRPQPTKIVAAAGHLGLDHLGAELGHERAAERAGDNLRELEHADAFERSAGSGHRDFLSTAWIMTMRPSSRLR